MIQELVNKCLDESFIHALSILIDSKIEPNIIKIELTKESQDQLGLNLEDGAEAEINLDKPVEVNEVQFFKIEVKDQVVDAVQYISYSTDNLLSVRDALTENNIDFFEDGERSVFINTNSTKIEITNMSTENKTEGQTEQLVSELESEKRLRLNLLADFQNYKKRVERERYQNTELANKTLVGKVLEVIDDCNRALNLDEEIKQNPKGMDMLLEKLEAIVTEQGLEPIQIENGSKFDPQTMEAITTVPATDGQESNIVIHVEQRGYIYNSNKNIYRVAKVIITK